MAFGGWAIIVGTVPVLAHLGMGLRRAERDLRSIYERIDEDLTDLH